VTVWVSHQIMNLRNIIVSLATEIVMLFVYYVV